MAESDGARIIPGPGAGGRRISVRTEEILYDLAGGWLVPRWPPSMV
jgi:hypothetical protein